MNKKSFLLVFFLLFSVVSTASDDGNVKFQETLSYSSEMDAVVEPRGNQNSSEMVSRVIVYVANESAVVSNLRSEKASVSSAKSVRQFDSLSDREVKVERVLSVLDGFTATVSNETLRQLEANPNVKVYVDRVERAFLRDSARIINADDVWNYSSNGINLTGLGESVCVLDTGVDYSRAAFGGCSEQEFLNGNCDKVPGGKDFVNNDSNPMDDGSSSHGTRMSMIIASIDERYRGVAPDAKIVAVKVLNNVGSGYLSDIVLGMDWCINNSELFNISVISMSLGGSIYYSDYCDADDPRSRLVDVATSKNISVVAATGNEGHGRIIAPSCIKDIIAVGATNKTDDIYSYSNRNNLTDLLAPGEDIALPYSSGYVSVSSGTSIAVPHVSGSLVLLKQYVRMNDESRDVNASLLLNALKETGVSITENASFEPITCVAYDYAGEQMPEHACLEFSDCSRLYFRSCPPNYLVNTSCGGGVHSLRSCADYYICSNVCNPRGNVTDSHNLTFKRVDVNAALLSLDRYSPVITVTSPSNGYILKGVETISARIRDFGAGVSSAHFRIFQNGTLINASMLSLAQGNSQDGNWTFALNSSRFFNGAYNFSINATDARGNSAFSDNVSAVINNAPIVDVVSPLNGSVIGGVVVFNFSVNRHISGVNSSFLTVYNSSGNVTGAIPMGLGSGNLFVGFWNASLNTSSLFDGEYYVLVNATDNQNASGTFDDLRVFLDNHPPAASFVLPTDGLKLRDDFVINVSVNDSGSGVRNVSFNFYNGSYVFFVPMSLGSGDLRSGFWNSSFNSTLFPDGVYNVSLNATDNQGRSAIVNASFVIDNPPSVGVVFPLNEQAIEGVAVFNFSINESASGVNSSFLTVYNSSGNVTGAIPMGLGSGNLFVGFWNLSFNSTLFADGVYNVSLNATDNQNVSRIFVRALVVDNDNPFISVLSPSNESVVSGEIVFNASVNDSGSGVKNVSFRIYGFESRSIIGDSMSLGSGSSRRGFWDASFDAGSLSGAYVVSVVAFDWLNRSVVSDNITIRVNRVISDDDGGRSGGGGSSGGGGGGSSGGGGGGSSGGGGGGSSGGGGGGSSGGGGGGSSGGGGGSSSGHDYSRSWDSLNEGYHSFNVSKSGFPITFLGFRLSESVKSAELKITKSETRPSYVKTGYDGDVYGYLVVQKGINESSVKNVNVKFKVERDWVEGRNSKADDVVLAGYLNDKWEDLETTLINSLDESYEYAALSPKLSDFAIALPKKIRSSEENEASVNGTRVSEIVEKKARSSSSVNEETPEEEKSDAVVEIKEEDDNSIIFYVVVVVMCCLLVVAAYYYKSSSKR